MVLRWFSVMWVVVRSQFSLKPRWRFVNVALILWVPLLYCFFYFLGIVCIKQKGVVVLYVREKNKGNEEVSG